VIPDPYDLLRAHPDVTMCLDDLPDGQRGRWYPDIDTIVIDRRLSQAERRCTLAHELTHRRFDDDPNLQGWFAEWAELRCRREAARMLIPHEALADALIWCHDENLAEMADHLWVDVDTLRDRVMTLTAAEAAAIRVRMRNAGKSTGGPWRSHAYGSSVPA
jgi:Zn-dependent peptidase ImmA (M78 family)